MSVKLVGRPIFLTTTLKQFPRRGCLSPQAVAPDHTSREGNFINSALLGIVVNIFTLVGMAGVMFYINWRFTLIALSIAPALFAVVYYLTRRIKKASREVRKKESELVSIVQEVLTSVRVVKAFAREDFEWKHRITKSGECGNGSGGPQP